MYNFILFMLLIISIYLFELYELNYYTTTYLYIYNTTWANNKIFAKTYQHQRV